MSVRGLIGLFRPDAGWRLLLAQLGLPVDRVPSSGDIRPSSFSAIIVDQPVTDTQAARLEAYLKEGGAILDTGRFFERLHGSSISTGRIRSFVPADRHELMKGIWLVDVFDDARFPESGAHDPIHMITVGKGRLAVIGLEVSRLMLDRRRMRKRFPADGAQPNEITSRVSKGELRHVVERLLRWLHLDRGLPYLHLWYFPNGAESVFAYRIDSDYGDRRSIGDLHTAAADRGIRLTWFLHVGAHEAWLREFARFDGDEIAIHGFRHRTFESFDENRANIREAMALLERAGFHPRGFASPNGTFNEGVAAALHDLGLSYSSEFSIDYDNLPSFVPNRAGAFSTLQVPVHPISIGSLLRAKLSDVEMKRYYRHRFERSLAMHDPAFFYHHPLHGHIDVMADTLDAARESGIPNVTMGEYADWWRLRSGVRPEIGLTPDGSFTVRGELASGVVLAAQREDGAFATIDAAGTFAVKDLHWRTIRPVVPPPSDVGALRRPGLRLLRHSLEDFNARSRQ